LMIAHKDYTRLPQKVAHLLNLNLVVAEEKEDTSQLVEWNKIVEDKKGKVAVDVDVAVVATVVVEDLQQACLVVLACILDVAVVRMAVVDSLEVAVVRMAVVDNLEDVVGKAGHKVEVDMAVVVVVVVVVVVEGALLDLLVRHLLMRLD